MYMKVIGPCIYIYICTLYIYIVQYIIYIYIQLFIHLFTYIHIRITIAYTGLREHLQENMLIIN